MKIAKLLLILSTLIFSISACTQKEEDQWIDLFNGKDLTGWDIKISGYELNDNYKNTFLVEDSIIKVNYAEYDTFTNDYGHLYYHKPFSHYRLKMEYRIFGELTPGSPYYAEANSGVMLHSQSAASQQLDQGFPASIEMQFLSRIDSSDRATGNLASPGTHVVKDGKLWTDHMMYSDGPTFGDEWVSVEAIVLGDSIVHHVVEGDTVLTYQNPQIGGWENEEDQTDWVKDRQWFKDNKGMPLKEGYIALQAEGHPVWFRNIKLLDLSEKFKKSE
ncbi:3-keto-disaccharide hydrolase [Jiulongibacter sp. NS-SX5]|uniref:3-keto-disaccharide hydrolase n=1 Tax=Jiulongibacter sp. NS-SX5 TaxID=3463854 RepID=UPI00405A3B3A